MPTIQEEAIDTHFAAAADGPLTVEEVVLDFLVTAYAAADDYREIEHEMSRTIAGFIVRGLEDDPLCGRARSAQLLAQDRLRETQGLIAEATEALGHLGGLDG
jgi:hypothetical protein